MMRTKGARNEYGLTYLQCLGIRHLRKMKWTYQELAEHYQVSVEAVEEVCNRPKLNYPEFFRSITLGAFNTLYKQKNNKLFKKITKI